MPAQPLAGGLADYRPVRLRFRPARHVPERSTRLRSRSVVWDVERDTGESVRVRERLEVARPDVAGEPGHVLDLRQNVRPVRAGMAAQGELVAAGELTTVT